MWPFPRRSVVEIRGSLRDLDEAADPRARATVGWLGGAVGEGCLGTADVAIRVGFVRRAGAVASLTMRGPRIEDDGLTALRATRAFEIARDTLDLT